MVGPASIVLVKQELTTLNIDVVDVQPGLALLRRKPGEQEAVRLSASLAIHGYELLCSTKLVLCEKIRHVIFECLSNQQTEKYNFSKILSSFLELNYSYLSSTFSEVEGITIQQYIILQKIEKVKELLVHDDLNLTEISYQLHYSSVAHLSAQFKKITGSTPRAFRQLAKTQFSQEHPATKTI